MSEFKYVGSELDLFAVVHNWKSYWSRQIQPFLSGDVLEVGAGLGANTPYLNRGDIHRWVCLEPDPALAAQLLSKLKQTTTVPAVEVRCGTLRDVGCASFDTILYIDVLEHIEDDRKELEDAASLLREGGRLIVLSPAHQQLFTPFDSAIGHFRRYNKSMLRRISPASLRLEKMWYLDSAGLLLSTANRLFLRQSMPKQVQLRFWDRYVIPISLMTDKWLLGSVGKTIVAVWERPD